MSSHRVMLDGISCAIIGATAGAVAVARVKRPATAAAPNESPSDFFQDLRPSPNVESISHRSYEQRRILGSSASMSGGGLRWGQRNFIACRESAGDPREQVSDALEVRVDEALLAAGLQCPNPTNGVWTSNQPFAVYSLKRRYRSPGRSGTLRLWLIAGENGQQSTIIMTIDEAECAWPALMLAASAKGANALRN